MPRNHRQVTVSANGMTADVDEDLAGLIPALWKADILTVMSCQDNVPAGYVWLMFASAIDAEMFVDMVVQGFDEELDSLWSRAYGENDLEGDWFMRVGPRDDFAYLEDVGDDDVRWVSEGRPRCRLEVSVRFPRTDLLAVLQAFDVDS